MALEEFWWVLNRFRFVRAFEPLRAEADDRFMRMSLRFKE